MKELITTPSMVYANDSGNNCIIIKWGVSGYYNTDFPKGKYTDDIINEMNAEMGVTSEEKEAMVICSMVAQDNPYLNWEEHYKMCLKRISKPNYEEQDFIQDSVLDLTQGQGNGRK